LTLDIKAANVEAIKFKSWRVHQNNLVPHLHGVFCLRKPSKLIPHITRWRSWRSICRN
jgi:hypothetical protein